MPRKSDGGLAMDPIKLLFAGDFCIRHNGADHMTPEEEQVMIQKQEAVLQSLNITRD